MTCLMTEPAEVGIILKADHRRQVLSVVADDQRPSCSVLSASKWLIGESSGGTNTEALVSYFLLHQRLSSSLCLLMLTVYFSLRSMRNSALGL